MKLILPVLMLTLAGTLRAEDPALPREEPASALPEGAGRVLQVESPKATIAFTPQMGAVSRMIEEGLRAFAGKSSVTEAWLSLVSTQDVVGLKVFSAPGRNSGTRPVVVAALIETLLEAGIPASQIVVWDRRSADLKGAGFYELRDRYGVRVVGSQEEGYDPEVFYETPLLGKLVYGDLEFGRRGEGVGRRSFVSKVVTRTITKFVTVSPLLNHNLAGISGALFGCTVGNMDNVLRFEQDSERLEVAVPEIYALPEFSERAVLHILDALICQYQGEERTMLHYASALNQVWFSKDPVALDVLGIREISAERKRAGQSEPAINEEIYKNAELLDLGIADLQKIKAERLKID